MTIHRPATDSDTETAVTFPHGFRWGAATAAYQIEGAVSADGRGLSIWDTFSHTPGAVIDGATGDDACDHYHRFADDVRLMADLGLTAYRFSISWPRVQPTGQGSGNTAGLDFYRRLVDELLDHGIEPWPTLYHWDLPQELEDAGGWPVRETAQRLADYAALVHDALGDRVRQWTTLNEPWCTAFLGYASGEHAPGRRDGAAAIRAAHHLMLAHGHATQALRAADPTVNVGITVNLYAVSPGRSTDADHDAVRRIDGLANRFFLDPLLRGEYPADVLDDVRPVTGADHVQDGDLDIIATPVDFLGINYYSRYVVSGLDGDGGSGQADASTSGSPWPGSEHVRFVRRSVPVTAMGWEIDPDGLTETLERVHRDYTSVPLYVTENGAAFDDAVDGEGRVNDPDRIAYVDAHLRACHAAVERGVPVRGYFVWSLMDNFEWAYGYTKRFGIVRVDFDDQRRIPKASASWYADVIRRNGLPIMGS